MNREIFVCNNCNLGKCFDASDSAAMTETGELSKECKYRYSKVAKFKLTDKYQITEKPEPVYVLEIPRDIKREQAQAAIDANEIVYGSRVEIYETHVYEYAIRQFNGSKIYDHIPKSWLKQKPAEPTVDELQERLRRVVEIVVGSGSSVSDKRTIEFILDIANGEA